MTLTDLTAGLRRLLFRGLGTKRYLLLVSRVYLWGVRLGLGRRRYPELFFLDELVQPGSWCVDIGANLGYYTLMLSRICGAQGRVLAVEPVPLFRDVLQSNIQTFGAENATILPFALGPDETTVRMGTPEVEGVFRHGCTRVLDSEDDHKAVYDVEMRRPDDLFRGLERLDFIKCDVEGYETQIFRHLTDTLDRYRPVVQVEINTVENRAEMLEIMEGHGYQVYALQAGLTPLDEKQFLSWEGHDFYFI